MVIILLSSNPEVLTVTLSEFARTATVEAEYGSAVVCGSVETLAHHGSRSGNPCPCLSDNTELDLDAVGVSHLDLDALGGILALQNRKPGNKSFWALAAFIDLNGAHKLAQSGADEIDIDRLYAWWAWSEAHKVYPNRDGSISDVSAWVEEACLALMGIFGESADLMAAGVAFRKAGEALNAESFRQAFGRVLYRRSDSFVNHLYASPTGKVFDAVVCYNPKQGSITVSFAAPGARDNACGFCQSLWGKLAGGHKGIAGSPRGQKMTRRQAVKAAKSLAFFLNGRERCW